MRQMNCLRSRSTPAAAPRTPWTEPELKGIPVVVFTYRAQ